MICTIPLNARLSVFMKNFQQQQMKNKDTRIKLMNEILNGIRVIKLYAWGARPSCKRCSRSGTTTSWRP